MQLTKFRAFIIIITLIASGVAYAMGRGVDIGRAVVESRCSAGAFIKHSPKASALQADVHSDGAVSAPSAGGQAIAYAPVPLLGSNLVVNGNLETLNNTKPRGWDSNAVGNNSSKFSLVAGQNSRVAVRIDTTQYLDGTADWFGANIAAKPGAYYQFTDAYRSNVTTRAVLMLKDTTGKSQFLNLQPVPPATGWTSYTQRFFVPSNVKEILVSHPLDRVGWLETDNYTLQLATAPAYQDGMVSVTFDDGWRSIHTNALPLMERYQVVSTQYLVSGILGQLSEYMKPGQVYDFTKLGHEIASHSVDHPDLTQINDADLTRQLAVSKEGLSKCYQPVTDFAPPFGTSNENTITRTKNLYQTSRSTEVGFNSSDTFNPYLLKVQNVRGDTSPEQMTAWLATAKANRVWLILVYHQVDDAGGEYSRTPADFESDLRSIKSSGLDINTMHNAYLKTQNQE